MPAVEPQGGGVLIRVRVQPKASRDAVAWEPDGRLRIALTAPPVEGAANAALCAFVARRLGLAKRAVTIVHGEKNRDKVLRVESADAQTVRAALGAPPGAGA